MSRTATEELIHYVELSFDGRDFACKVDGEHQPDNFTVKAFEDYIMGNYPVVVHNIIYTAGVAGWSLKVLDQNGMTLTNPEGDHTIGLSAGRPPNTKHAEQMTRRIIDHGDPVQRALTIAYLSGGGLPRFTMPVEFEKPVQVRDGALVQVQTPRARKRKKHEPVPTQRASGEPVVVREGPFMSHRTKGRGERPGTVYPSPMIIERHWSDGRVTYKCARCDFERDSYASIPGHWKKHVKEDENLRRSEDEVRKVLVEDPSYQEAVGPPKHREYSPRKDTIERLMRVIKEAGTKDPYMIAKRILVWEHEQQCNAEPREPLTDAERLDKILALADRGTYVEQRKEQEKQAEQLKELVAKQESAQAEIDRLRQELAEAQDALDEWEAYDSLKPQRRRRKLPES